MSDQPTEHQSNLQKRISFATSEHVATVVELLKECGGAASLVGESEYATVVNAVTLDAQQDMIKKFINNLDMIRNQNFQEQ